MTQKNGPAPKGETGDLFTPANTPADSTENLQKQSVSDAPTHLIGSPKVSVENFTTHTRVTVSDVPWGWGCYDREFLHKPLHTKSGAAGRYADELRRKFAEAAWTEHARQERQKSAYLREKVGGAV